MMEIGSEFWLEDNYNKKRIKSEVDYFFLGRMALKVILLNLKEEGLQSVLFPSYCCSSMLNPFVEAGFEIDFYNVDYINGVLSYDINKCSKADIFFATNYFGYNSADMDYYVTLMRESGKTTIEDNTHSMLIKNVFHSDYVFGSIRKWIPTLAGGAIYKAKNKVIVNKSKADENICNIKMEAMRLKADYIIKDKGQKNKYLPLYERFNSFTDNTNAIADIDDYSLAIIESQNYEEIKSRRRSNAEYLHAQLQNLGIMTMFEYAQEDCPLFVPLILNNKNERDSLRRKLIDNNIFSPIHWQRPDNCQSSVYDLELSLVCDQRYSLDHMKKIIKKIKE